MLSFIPLIIKTSIQKLEPSSIYLFAHDLLIKFNINVFIRYVRAPKPFFYCSQLDCYKKSLEFQIFPSGSVWDILYKIFSSAKKYLSFFFEPVKMNKNCNSDFQLMFFIRVLKKFLCLYYYTI